MFLLRTDAIANDGGSGSDRKSSVTSDVRPPSVITRLPQINGLRYKLGTLRGCDLGAMIRAQGMVARRARSPCRFHNL